MIVYLFLHISEIFMNKNWMTLVELVISITISATLFAFVFVFITDSLEWLHDSNVKTKIMDNIFNTKNKIARYVKWGYISNNIIWTWWISNKVLYLKTEDDLKWVIFWIVNSRTMKLQDYDVYWNNNIWYRDLSDTEVLNVDLDNSLIYDMIFFKDKIIDDSIIKSFNPELYNSDVLIDLNIEYLENFNESLIWKTFSGTFINKEEIYKTNLIF